ncbi:MAG: DNA gyrase subunit A [Planctomycetes bacterium]|nr:DNA gyrase subunit A [Planctomycetota bacterium]
MADEMEENSEEMSEDNGMDSPLGTGQLVFENEQIEDLLIEEEMRDSYLTYAMSTIMDRALPDVRDGLKPSQRRILVAMNDLNLGPRSKHRKCAKIAGDTSGNYHPHGESVVYPTLVRLGQKWNMRHCLIDPQGNFGSIDGDPPAAMRYTEARMTALAVEMLDDLNLETVDMKANYDDTRTEPVVLPAKFPNLLVNGGQGIAVGMATSLPPHNLAEVCDALVAMMENPDISIRELLKIIHGPDFPTGGMICGREGIVQAYTTGRGKIIVRGRMHTEQRRGGKTTIVITEIPYQVLRSTLIERIADTVKNGRISDISDVQDHSDRTGMRIVVDLKKGAEPEVVVNQLYQYTPLQNTFSIINIALVAGAPRTLNIRQLLEQFLVHRKEVIRRRTTFLLRRARQRAHILVGLIYAVCDIEEVIKLIRSAQTREQAIEKLQTRAFRVEVDHPYAMQIPKDLRNPLGAGLVHLTRVQAEAIGRLQLIQLVGLEIEKLVGEYSELCEEVAGYEAILADDARVVDIIREDVLEMKSKYSNPRRTEIIGAIGEFDIEDLIAEEDVVVTLSHAGYIKRMPLTTYRRQGRGGIGIIGSDAKEGDFIENLFIASTHDFLLVLTNLGRVHWLKVYDVPNLSRTTKGRAIINLLQLEKEETIQAVINVRHFDERFLMTVTQKGQVKKTPLTAYSRPRKGGIHALGLAEGDSLIDAVITRGDDEIVLATRDGHAIRFNETDVRPMSRTAGGVRGISLRKGDKVVDMAIVDTTATLLTVCENGHGKRTSAEEYRLQGRGGQGVINIRTSERNGKVVSMKVVRDNDELMMITSNGMIVRTAVSGLRSIGRATQGVRVIALRKGDKLVGFARVIGEENGQPDLPLQDDTLEQDDTPRQDDTLEQDDTPESE